MNDNGNKILKITLLSILSVFLIGIMIFVIVAKWSFESFSNVFKDKNNYELIYSEIFDDVNNVNFDLVNADLDIRYSNDDKVKLEIYDNNKESFDVNFSESSLSVKFKSFKAFCIGFCFSNRRAVLYLPQDYSGKIDVYSASGEIESKSFKSSNILISTVSGDVFLEGAKDTNIKTVSGDITIYDADSLLGSSTSGSLEVYNLLSYIDYSSVSGDIDIYNFKVLSNSNISTISGDVNIEGINPVNINTSTVSGEVEVNTKDINSEIKLSIKTTSGDIEID